MTQSQSSAPAAATLSARVLVGGLIAAAVNVALLFGARARARKKRTAATRPKASRR